MKQTIVWTVLPRGLLPGGELSLSVLVSPRLTPDVAEAPLGAFPGFLGTSPDINWASHTFSFGIEVATGPVLPVLPVTPIEPVRPVLPIRPVTPVTPVRPIESVRPTSPRLTTVQPAAGVLDPALFGRLFAAVVVRGHAFKDLRARKIRSFPVAHVLQAIRDRYAQTALLSPFDRPAALVRKDPLAALDFTRPEAHKNLGAKLESILADHGYVPPQDPDLALDFFQALTFHGFKGRAGQPPLVAPKVDFHEAIALLADYPALLRKLGLVFDLVVPAPAQPFTRLRVHPHVAPAIAPAATYTAVTPWTAVDYQPGVGFTAAPADPTERRGGFFDLARPGVEVTQVDVDGAALKVIGFVESAMQTEARGTFGAATRAALPALRSAGLSVSLTDRAGRLHRLLERAGVLDDALGAGHGSDQILHAEDLTRGLRVDVEDPVLGRWCSLHRRIPDVTVDGPGGPTPLDLGVTEDEGTLTAAVSSPTDPAKGDDLFVHETLFHWTGWSLSAERPGARVDLVGDTVARSSNPAANALGIASRHRVVPGSLPRLRFGRSYRLRARAVDLAGNALPHTSTDAAAATPAAPYLRFEPVPAPILSREADPRPGESMDRAVIRSHNASPALDATPTAETSARGVFPAKGAVLLAEQHGLLDASTGAMMADAATHQRLAERDPIQIPEVTLAPTSVDPLPLAQVRYLPDPLARGVRVRGLPDGDRELRFDGAAWPDTQPFRIELCDGAAASAWDASTRTLRVSLPKGQVTTLRLSSLLPGPGALDVLGLWSWLRGVCPAPYLPTYEQRALAGELWAITPDRAVVLVHAVQQPLRAPAFTALQTHRILGQTQAELRGAVDLDVATTGQVEVLARWSDRVDRPGSPTGDGWDDRVGQVGARPIDHTLADAIEFAGVRHQLPDTRYRRVAYHMVATSRFRECFVDAATPLDLTRIGAAVECDVLASARPAAPEIEYVIPTFAWSTDPERDGLASRRRGHGVRIYLRRPWFSSGDGELLGVVVAHGPRVNYADGVGVFEAAWLSGQVVPEVPERLRGLVTLWGSDPVWVSAATWPTPSLHHFPGKSAQAEGLVLDELDGPAPAPWSIAVAGHPVAFDPERQLWYCDLELDTGPAYFPFVRLALCRFQPRAVAEAEVSRVALADFIQLPPDRLAWVGSDPADPRALRLSVSGEAPRGRADAPIATVVSARVEVLLDPAADHWIPDPNAPVLLAQTQITGTVAVWSGDLRLPRPRGEIRQRLVVEEHELLPRDPARQNSAVSVAMFSQPGLRLVYADVIEV